MKIPPKKITIPIIIILVLAIIITIMYISIVSSKTVIAQLNIEQGTVFLNEKIVEGDVILKKGDIIKTGDNGLATIILYESVIINLEQNTEISLDDLTKENPTISQNKGESWNQITNLFGIDSYTVKSGNSVASVRGTAFGISNNKIIVDEGQVNYKIEGKEFNVVHGKAVEKIQDKIQERDLTPDEINQIKLKRAKTIIHLKRLRKMEIEKHPKIVKMIKDKYSITDQNIDEGLESADLGMVNLNEFREKSPVQIESFDKIIEITDKIKKLNEVR